MLALGFLSLAGAAHALPWLSCLGANEVSSMMFDSAGKAGLESDCNAFCKTRGFTYTAWSSTSFDCLCTNDYPSAIRIEANAPVVGTSPFGETVRCNTNALFSYSLSGSEWQFGGCRYDPGFDREVPFTFVPYPAQCFAFCQSSFPATDVGANQQRMAAWDPPSAICRCYRGNNEPAVVTGECWSSAEAPSIPPAAAYYWTAPAAASGARRRAEAIAHKQLRDAAVKAAPCPRPLAGCRVTDGSDAYECLDLANELESCGGCAYGEVGTNATAAGTNCLDLPGVRPGGVTCSRGVCAVSGCKQGWTLQDGKCV